MSAALLLPVAMGTCPEWCSRWQCDGSMWCSSGKMPAPCDGCREQGSSSDVTDLSHRLEAAIMLASRAPTAEPTPPKHCQKFVLMSFGRSGTTAIANAIEVLTEGTSLDRELMGGSPSEMGRVDDPVSTARSYLSRQCTYHPTAGLTGFKLKPFMDVSAAGQPTESRWADWMTWLRDNNASVLYSHRNALDRIISGQSTVEVNNLHGNQKWHFCSPGDNACIDAHTNTRVTLKTGDQLLSRIREDLVASERILMMLTRYGIRHHAVTFEMLFDGSENEQLATWRGVIRFLQPWRTDDDVSTGAVANALGGTIRVGAHHQKDRVANYPSVVGTLNTTEFANLLH